MTATALVVEMILGEPTFRAIVDMIEAEGCPYCGSEPGTISINGPSEIILHECGHEVDATPYLDLS